MARRGRIRFELYRLGKERVHSCGGFSQISEHGNWHLFPKQRSHPHLQENDRQIKTSL